MSAEEARSPSGALDAFFIVLAVGTTCITLSVYLIRCVAASWLWAWFAEPLGLPPLPYWQLAGLYTAFSVRAQGHRVELR